MAPPLPGTLARKDYSKRQNERKHNQRIHKQLTKPQIKKIAAPAGAKERLKSKETSMALENAIIAKNFCMRAIQRERHKSNALVSDG